MCFFMEYKLIKQMKIVVVHKKHILKTSHKNYFEGENKYGMAISTFNADLLNKKYEATAVSVAEKKSVVATLEGELANSQETMSQVSQQHNNLLTWADMYSSSPMDVKKMIAAQLISAVKVSRDYKIEIDFKVSAKQLGLEKETEIANTKKKNKSRSDEER